MLMTSLAMVGGGNGTDGIRGTVYILVALWFMDTLGGKNGSSCPPQSTAGWEHWEETATTWNGICIKREYHRGMYHQRLVMI